MKKKVNYAPVIILSLLVTLFFLLAGAMAQKLQQQHQLSEVQMEATMVHGATQRITRLLVTETLVEKDLFLLQEYAYQLKEGSGKEEIEERCVLVINAITLFQEHLLGKEMESVDIQLHSDQVYLATNEISVLLAQEQQSLEEEIEQILYAMIFTVLGLFLLSMYTSYHYYKGELREKL